MLGRATRASLVSALEARKRTERSTHVLRATAADGAPLSLLLVLQFFEHQVRGGTTSRYWATLLIDVDADMRRHGLGDSASQRKRQGFGGEGADGGAEAAERPKPFWAVARAPASTKSFGSLFVHRLPASWKWFDSKLMEETLTSAVHALDVAFTMVDVTAYDQPMVWLSRGFERMTGLSRNEAGGRNCRLAGGKCPPPFWKTAAPHRPP